MPQLVPREMLQQANVLPSMMRGALRVIGPTVGALLVVTVGPGWAVAVDAHDVAARPRSCSGSRSPSRPRPGRRRRC